MSEMGIWCQLESDPFHQARPRLGIRGTNSSVQERSREGIAAAYLRYRETHAQEDIWGLDELDSRVRQTPSEAWEIARILVNTGPNDEALAYVARKSTEVARIIPRVNTGYSFTARVMHELVL
jgi:hypothetical protein